jgi:nucleotide-binding universal stress UspA family protein
MNLESGRIVVTLDGSKNAESAVKPAAQLAAAWSVPLEFVYVVDPDGTPVPLPNPQEGLDRFNAYVRRVLEREDVRGVEWTAVVRPGEPPRTIIESASGARLIVMATHGRGGLRAMFLGSVTDKVVRSGRVPVLTVPVEGTSDLRCGPILVPLDGSDEAARALPVARPLAATLGTGLALMRAYPSPVYTVAEFSLYEMPGFQAERQIAEQYLAEIAHEGEQVLVAMKPAVSAIEELADRLNACLIVLSTRGKGLAHRLALGSTTDQVLHSVARPILVLPHVLTGNDPGAW